MVAKNILLLCLLATLSFAVEYEEYVKSPLYEREALRTLQSIRKRLRSGPRLTSSPFQSKRDRWRRGSCRSWHEPCVPWSSVSLEQCCNRGSQVCQCNLWMQNCRCASRAWG
ncbi:Ccwamide neuropeptide [Plakobranchus ocellatus]|uniref:Ccwamide neuropeptide n=1 Tax=Plakobranchus ocellatus TaxID=259542 RepID=A0AAV4DW96_9GAST|nr:Ccwamide neuropeptide [Plakobranchus ocellatus]